MRRIVAAAVHQPTYRLADLWAEGPDEDAFTLAVAAAERLLERPGRSDRTVDAVHVAGDLPPEADLGLPEALGLPSVAIHRHGPGMPGLSAALSTAARRDGSSSSLVLVADVSRRTPPGPASGAGAVAIELADASGTVVLGHGGRRHPPHRAPDASAWTRDALLQSGISGENPAGRLYLAASASPPVLLATWRRTVPRMAVLDGGLSPTGVGPAPTMAPAVWLLDLLRQLPIGEVGVLAHSVLEATTFLGVHRDGATPELPAPPSETPGPDRPAAPDRIAESIAGSVSEGAYLPRPTYLEGLPSRWRFEAETCPACRSTTFPKRARCRACGHREGLTPTALPRGGVVLASTVVAPGAQPTEFDPWVERSGAYGVVMVELAPNVRATMAVADGPSRPLPVGSKVRSELRRLYATEGEWRYGRKALASA